MLLMPYLSRIMPSFLPVGVVLLVVINLFVFFGWQQGDDARYQRAVDYYVGSVLAEVEPPLYRDYLAGRGDQDEAERVDAVLKRQRQAVGYLVQRMNGDREFMDRLRDGRLISPEDDLYGSWRQARRSFDGLMSNVVSQRHAFHGDAPTLANAFSSLFLHGDIGHLFGNMLVLVLVATAVEGLVGTLAFLGIYLIGGVAAAWLWMLAGAGTSLIGASGAIAAAMGAFSVLLRWRRIPFFYFIIVYFDVIRAPALLALPIWLLNEALQLYWRGGERVAYEAHIGGLLVGGLLALPFVVRAQARLLAAEPAPEAAGNGADEAGVFLRRARDAMRAVNLDYARVAYGRAIARAGHDLAVWREALNVLKLAPASEEYHKAVRAFLRLAARDEPAREMLPEVFRDYLKLAQPRPRLDADLLAGVAEVFTGLGRVAELEQAVRLLHALAPADPRCRRLLLAAAGARRNAGDAGRADELTRMAGAA